MAAVSETARQGLLLARAARAWRLAMVGLLLPFLVAASGDLADTAAQNGAQNQTLSKFPSDASCTRCDECASGQCVPTGRSSGYCAAKADECPRGWSPVHMRSCDSKGVFCGGELAPFCVRPIESPPCGPRSCSFGDPCSRDSDCGEPSRAACLLEDRQATGTCTPSCLGVGQEPPDYPGLTLPPAVWSVADLDAHTPSCSTPPVVCSAGNSCQPVVGRSRKAYCAPGAGGYNVLAAGAVGDGARDDAPAIRCALEAVGAAGGGTVCLPAGEYRLDRGLEIGSHTTLQGVGHGSVLKRSEGGSITQLANWTVNAQGDWVRDFLAGNQARLVLINSGYRYGNEGITLKDFKIDGSLLQRELQPSGGGPDDIRVSIGFSSVKDTTIDGLLLENVPQDGIALRGGGVNTRVVNSIFDGWNMKWHNGAAINSEFRTGQRLYGPVLIEDNTFIDQAPAYCCTSPACGGGSGLPLACEADADCGPDGNCGELHNLIAVSAIGEVASPHPAGFDAVRDNHFTMGNKHVAILCGGAGGCDGALIEGNTIESNGSSYVGVLIDGGARVVRNRFFGRQDDIAAIIRRFDLSQQAKLVVLNNLVRDFSVNGQGSVHDFAATEVEIRGNTVLNVTNGHGIKIGQGCTANPRGVVSGNTVHLSSGFPTFRPVFIYNAANVAVVGNNLSPALWHEAACPP